MPCKLQAQATALAWCVDVQAALRHKDEQLAAAAAAISEKDAAIQQLRGAVADVAAERDATIKLLNGVVADLQRQLAAAINDRSQVSSRAGKQGLLQGRI